AGAPDSYVLSSVPEGANRASDVTSLGGLSSSASRRSLYLMASRTTCAPRYRTGSAGNSRCGALTRPFSDHSSWRPSVIDRLRGDHVTGDHEELAAQLPDRCRPGVHGEDRAV